jgi:pre-mRNA-processing factor 19
MNVTLIHCFTLCFVFAYVVSGEIPQEAVVSTKTGQLFEKRLIEKHIANGGKCPLTGGSIMSEDLLDVKAAQSLRPRSIAGNSIPNMIANFQNEWDEVMLETFTLKQHLDATRKELTQALYQHDAACRVIARLIKERDEARAMLLQQSQQGSVPQGNGAAATAAAATEMVVDEAVVDGLGVPVLAALTAKCDELSVSRKGRKNMTIEGVASKESLEEMGALIANGGKGKKASELLGSFSPHKTDKPGVTCLAVHAPVDGPARWILSGGVDKQAVLMNAETGDVLSKFSGHSKKLTAVAFHPQFHNSGAVYTCSADATVKQWRSDADASTFSEAFSYDHHTGEVTGFTVHPTGDYAISTSLDGSWAFLDLNRGSVLKKVMSSESGCGYTCGSFHPDGLILGMGTNTNVVKMFDVREQAEVSCFQSHTAPVTSVAFSENGYICASASEDGTVKIWDLRKLNQVKTTIERKCAAALLYCL